MAQDSHHPVRCIDPGRRARSHRQGASTHTRPGRKCDIAMDGERCRQWLKARLSPPDEVKATTKKYRLLRSELKRFIDDRCALGSAEFEPARRCMTHMKNGASYPKTKG